MKMGKILKDHSGGQEKKNGLAFVTYKQIRQTNDRQKEEFAMTKEASSTTKKSQQK